MASLPDEYFVKVTADVDPKIAEMTRAERHHDVLCRAMDRQFENAGGSGGLTDELIAEFVRRSRLAADLAYPPPTNMLREAVDRAVTMLDPDAPFLSVSQGGYTVDAVRKVVADLREALDK